MNLIKFDPAARKNLWFPSVFDDFFNGNISDFMGNDFATNMPSVNVAEDAQGYHMELAAPGLTKDDFRISLDKDRLTISSEKESKRETADAKFTRREFNYTTFSRSFILPKTVDKDRISAKYENGILKLLVPKKAEVVKDEKSRVIEIS